MTERQVGDGDVVEGQVEVRPALDQLGLDARRDLGALAQELLGVVLRDDGLENLVADRGEDALVEVGTELPVELRQLLDDRTPEDAQLDVDHLKVLGSGDAGDLARLGPDVDYDGTLDDGDHEVGALVAYVGEDTAAKGVEHDSALATVDVVDAGVDGEGAHGEGAGGGGDAAENLVHGCRLELWLLDGGEGRTSDLSTSVLRLSCVCGAVWLVLGTICCIVWYDTTNEIFLLHDTVYPQSPP